MDKNSGVSALRLDRSHLARHSVSILIWAVLLLSFCCSEMCFCSSYSTHKALLILENVTNFSLCSFHED